MSSFLQLNATDQSTSHAAVIISGGSAGNAVLDAFTSLFDVCHFVLPVSDNGGSSSEIIRLAITMHGITSLSCSLCCEMVRVLGGPSLGRVVKRHAFLYILTTDIQATYAQDSFD